MNLTDQEILELNQLCSAVIDERLDSAQRERLEQLLATSEDARQYYVRAIAQSASLHSYASEMHAEAPDAMGGHRLSWRAATVWLGALAAAAAVVLSLVNRHPPVAPAAATSPKSEYVARITGSKQPHWIGGDSLQPGARVRKGQRLELVAGLAEITFDSGAQVLLEGPASLDVNSAWDTTLRHGALKANVPHEAIGFRISNSEVDVVDLGTEFTMATDASGAAEVFVLKGEVEAQPRDASDQDTVLLREKESRRFGNSGISTVSGGSEQRFALLTQPLSLDRLTPKTNCIHWSFDEVEGGVFKADSAGTPIGAYNAQLVASAPEDFHSVHTAGLHGHALKFDGNVFARASFPGLSNTSTHTVAFWVKVPEDAQLSDAYAMVAWGTVSPKLGSRPVHIGWNRNPAEGNVGALRTDFGGGCAIGSTSLRDGRWHHITVVFVPGEDDEQIPVQVKQYVDGRLESGTTIPGKTHVMKTEDAAAVRDILWLGRRLVASSRKNDRSRFRGEIEELYIADRALAPQEIVELFKENQPPESEFANTSGQGGSVTPAVVF